ncbi:hypothetical protein [Candidatus Protochlamydia phocaeensis]|uniref:hypothetical protein n=1 Tax=Candidatus Protochlamydia phocaeensis TaxID=1414722 RepID=UPI000837DB43|nr:hypothetical protein [Candidatus Protochlamydia phocaeensis]
MPHKDSIISMDNVFLAIKETVCEDVQTHYPIPAFLHTTADLFGKAHLYYRTAKSYAFFQRAQEGNAGHPAVYGAALHLISDYTTVGSYALKVALITKCAEDLFHQYHRLYQSYRHLQQTFYCHFPTYHRVNWNQPSISQPTQFSPSFQLWLKVEVMGLMQQTLKVLRCAASVLWEAFKLSMCLRDAYLLANGDPQAKYDAFTELVADWERYQQQLRNDQALLRQEIAKGRLLADRILTKLDTDKTTAFILGQLEAGLTQVEQAIGPQLPAIQQAGRETLDVVLPIGHICSLQVDLSEGTTILSPLPPGRYPPWGGQMIEVIKAQANKSPALPLASQISNLTENLPILDPLNGLFWLAQKAQHTYQDWFQPIHC